MLGGRLTLRSLERLRVLRRRRRSPPDDLRLGERDGRLLSLGEFRRLCGDELRSRDDFRVTDLSLERFRGDRLRIFDAAASAAADLALALGDLERSRSKAAAAAAAAAFTPAELPPSNCLLWETLPKLVSSAEFDLDLADNCDLTCSIALNVLGGNSCSR